jgi:hypothetical protein
LSGIFSQGGRPASHPKTAESDNADFKIFVKCTRSHNGAMWAVKNDEGNITPALRTNWHAHFLPARKNEALPFFL